MHGPRVLGINRSKEQPHANVHVGGREPRVFLGHAVNLMVDINAVLVDMAISITWLSFAIVSYTGKIELCYLGPAGSKLPQVVFSYPIARISTLTDSRRRPRTRLASEHCGRRLTCDTDMTSAEQGQSRPVRLSICQELLTRRQLAE